MCGPACMSPECAASEMNDPEQAAHLLANAVVLLRSKNDAGMMSALREICAVQCEIITSVEGIQRTAL